MTKEPPSSSLLLEGIPVPSSHEYVCFLETVFFSVPGNFKKYNPGSDSIQQLPIQHPQI